MKTQDELKQHYRDVIIPLVAKYNYDNATDVKPWECVKFDGKTVFAPSGFIMTPPNQPVENERRNGDRRRPAKEGV